MDTIEELKKMIEDLEKKLIIVRGRFENCRICSGEEKLQLNDPPISRVEQEYHDAGHRFKPGSAIVFPRPGAASAAGWR